MNALSTDEKTQPLQLSLIRPQKKELTNPGTPAAHPEPAYRCFLPDLTGFTGPWLRRTRAHERDLFSSECKIRRSEKSAALLLLLLRTENSELIFIKYGGEGGI
jgi:hypothetical protein